MKFHFWNLRNNITFSLNARGMIFMWNTANLKDKKNYFDLNERKIYVKSFSIKLNSFWVRNPKLLEEEGISDLPSKEFKFYLSRFSHQVYLPEIPKYKRCFVLGKQIFWIIDSLAFSPRKFFISGEAFHERIAKYN